jgi:hypothetical protein
MESPLPVCRPYLLLVLVALGAPGCCRAIMDRLTVVGQRVDAIDRRIEHHEGDQVRLEEHVRNLCVALANRHGGSGGEPSRVTCPSLEPLAAIWTTDLSALQRAQRDVASSVADMRETLGDLKGRMDACTSVRDRGCPCEGSAPITVNCPSGPPPVSAVWFYQDLTIADYRSIPKPDLAVSLAVLERRIVNLAGRVEALLDHADPRDHPDPGGDTHATETCGAAHVEASRHFHALAGWLAQARDLIRNLGGDQSSRVKAISGLVDDGSMVASDAENFLAAQPWLGRLLDLLPGRVLCGADGKRSSPMALLEAVLAALWGFFGGIRQRVFKWRQRFREGAARSQEDYLVIQNGLWWWLCWVVFGVCTLAWAGLTCFGRTVPQLTLLLALLAIDAWLLAVRPSRRGWDLLAVEDRLKRIEELAAVKTAAPADDFRRKIGDAAAAVRHDADALRRWRPVVWIPWGGEATGWRPVILRAPKWFAITKHAEEAIALRIEQAQLRATELIRIERAAVS